MTQNLPARTGGQVLVDALRIHGVDCAFCVPGESFLPVLDALHDARDSIRLVVCRQEGGAAHMAEAYGKLTGKPGICVVTRGPGASNASIGVHTAAQDSTPMILIVGQVSTGVMGREAWQEIDLPGMFGPIAKWATQINSVLRIPEIISRAFHVAVSGRPGPVVVACPEDLLYQVAEVADLGACRRTQSHPGQDDLSRMRGMLEAARQPLLILGGGGWNAQACAAISGFVATYDLPVATGFRRQDLFDNRHPNYAGDAGVGVNAKLAKRIIEADLILAIGPRLGETTTSGNSLITAPKPKQRLIHVHADNGELGRVYQADLAINAGMPEFAAALLELPGPESISWSGWTRAARADYLEYLKPVPMPGTLDMGVVMTYLNGRLPIDAIVTNGAGNYTSWIHRFYQYRGFRTQLAPASGTMGYGLPAAIAAKLTYPERIVVCFAGDGCFLMSGQELATVRQYRLALVIVVVNNGMYGSIRMHQENNFPGKVYGTALENPDFVALAQAYGLHGQRVKDSADFPAAFENALSAGKAALLELQTDPEAITPGTTLSALRAQALSRR